MRTLAQWARELPRDLRTLDDVALDETRRAIAAAAELARRTVPVVTGALQRSIVDHHLPDGAEMRSNDPAAAALAAAGRPYLLDAVVATTRDLDDRIADRWTEVLVG